MKRKLTIAGDADLVLKAKRYARSQGVSLSSLVERALRETTGTHQASFSARWRGKFKADQRVGPRYEVLAKKYLQ